MHKSKLFPLVFFDFCKFSVFFVAAMWRKNEFFFEFQWNCRCFKTTHSVWIVQIFFLDCGHFWFVSTGSRNRLIQVALIALFWLIFNTFPGRLAPPCIRLCAFYLLWYTTRFSWERTVLFPQGLFWLRKAFNLRSGEELNSCCCSSLLFIDVTFAELREFFLALVLLCLGLCLFLQIQSLRWVQI